MIPNGARMRRARPGQRGYVTARWLAPIRLVAALLIVVGLAVSVPPSFGTVDGDHVGLLLHPLFPHAHGSAESLSSPDDRPAARDAAGSRSPPMPIGGPPIRCPASVAPSPTRDSAQL